MKPKPLSSLNHLTVPVPIKRSSYVARSTGLAPVTEPLPTVT
jgi:hypothetical protein